MDNHTLDLLQDCRNQLTYLNENFGEIQSTNALIARLTYAIGQVDKKHEPPIFSRPSWLSENEEELIFHMYRSNEKLRAVKYLLDIARKKAENEFYGLKWSKEYIESNVR